MTQPSGPAVPVGWDPDDHVYKPVTGAGSVTTSMLAPNAATQQRSAYGVAISPTTSSATPVDLPDLTLTFTPGGADGVTTNLLLMASGVFSDSLASAVYSLVFNVDGADQAQGNFNYAVVAANIASTAGLFLLLTGVTPTPHTIKVRWSTNLGTLTASVTQRELTILEFLR